MEKSHKLRASLIISVYNCDDFLRAVLESIAQQSCQDFELIVAEDGQHDSIVKVITAFTLSHGIPVTHLTQPDMGFRKNKILNQVICVSEGQYLLFIDGDCLLHKHYVATMLRHVEKGLCLFGRRAMLDKKLSQKMLFQKSGLAISVARLLFSRSRHIEEGLYLPFLKSSKESGLRGHSFILDRRDIVAINGFDEDFTEPYFGEDTDIERRLKLAGVVFRCLRFSALQYHLYHDSGDRSRAWNISRHLYRKKSALMSPVCVSGLSQYI